MSALLILGIDSSALAASAAVWDGEKVLSQCTVNNRLTHSQTLLPMIDHVLSHAGLALNDLGLLAAAAGPGSFTGLRIGLATVKGLSCGSGIPCLGVSTLEALAYNLEGFSGTACCAMDARVKQVYQAYFSLSPGRDGQGTIARLNDDRAVSLEALEQELREARSPVYFVGDGAELCWRQFGNRMEQGFLAPAPLRWQKGESVARLAGRLLEQGTQPVSAEALAPSYLRLSQAERERKAREEREK